MNPLGAKNEISTILISQERASLSMFGADFKTTGGYAPKYYSSWRGRITRIGDLTEKGSLLGITSKVRCTKNKIGIPKREAELELYFETGFDSENEYLKFICDLGIVTRAGAWFTNEEWGFKGQGRDSVLAFLQADQDLFNAVKNTVNAMLSGETIIDQQNNLEDEEEDGEVMPIDEQMEK